MKPLTTPQKIHLITLIKEWYGSQPGAQALLSWGNLVDFIGELVDKEVSEATNSLKMSLDYGGKIRTAFPDFDLTTLPKIPEGWRWSGDSGAVGPCFDMGTDESGVVWAVIVDYANVEDREMAGGRRFIVMRDCDWLFSTDDWNEVLTLGRFLKPL